MIRKIKIPVCLSLSLYATTLMAGMSISPLRLDLNNQSSIVSLTIFNRADTPQTNALQVQTSIKAWSQADGKDVYTDQNSILILPPIFGVPAGQSQVVRVALLKPNTTNIEQAYRIFVDQFTPQAIDIQSKNGLTTALSILLNMSIPVFVAPNLPKNITLAWALGTPNKQGLPIMVTNQGNTHVHFAKITLSSAQGQIVAEGNTPIYILSQSTMTDTLKLLQPLQKSQTYTIEAVTDDPQYPTLTGTVSP